MDSKAIELLAESALDAACAIIQKDLEVSAGDLAGVFFSDNAVKSSFIAYINAEIDNRIQLGQDATPEPKMESLVINIVRPSDNMTEIERANINNLFITLGDSVTDVVVEYRGSGDGGGIEEVNINGVLDSAVKVNLIRQYRGHDEVVTLSVDDAIRSVADDLIDRRHGGFENNEGGGGAITFDVANKTVQIDHYDYIVEEQYDHEKLML